MRAPEVPCTQSKGAHYPECWQLRSVLKKVLTFGTNAIKRTEHSRFHKCMTTVMTETANAGKAGGSKARTQEGHRRNAGAPMGDSPKVTPIDYRPDLSPLSDT